jgi:threonine synthase
MHFFSTNGVAPIVDFKVAAIKGQAPDGGLYFPQEIPRLSKSFLDNLSGLSKAEIAFEVIKQYIGNSITEDHLRTICYETVDFDFPLVEIKDGIFSLELFHGPTLAFKDVGARFMSRCLGYFSANESRKITVLVATSGDTGSAVANGFLGVKGVEVVILYPSKRVSHVQELQLTTLGQNIAALEVNGTFDDCQAMVKKAFVDDALNSKLFLTSANSINVARWLPQQFYYFFAWQQWKHAKPPVVAVPSGNFGNLCAGLLAYKSGLPATHFIAACNANKFFTQFLETNHAAAAKTIATISNAMDVGNPSNFPRIMELFGHDTEALRAVVSSQSVSDDDTRKTIRECFARNNYVLDPHGAVAYKALQDYLHMHKELKGYILETAHPIKFADVVEAELHNTVAMPVQIQSLIGRNKQSIFMEPEFENLKDWLLKHN